MNRHLKAFFKLLIFSGIVHTFIVGLYALINNKPSFINYFKILDISLLFPQILDIPMSTAISLAILLIIYLFFYFNQSIMNFD